MGVEHYENFPVASVLCPPRIRPAVVAIYHFARTADDLADEGTATPQQRRDALAAYRDELRAAEAGRAEGTRWPRIFGPLALAMREHALPGAPLHHLLDAFVQDTDNPIYADRAQVLDYCRRSADPIGRLFLHLYGIDAPDALRESDAVCSALQLINFWQDISIDRARGRVYVPQSDLHHHGLTVDDLDPARDRQAVRALVRDLCDWAEALMRQGAAIGRRVPGRGGWELRLVVAGGLRVLEKIRAIDHATTLTRPKLRASDVPLLLGRAVAARLSGA
ncbi:MAG: squalene synthase HpnC [Rubrivivax sp.]|nr:squalene synthase HpnC [Rubrivivax sp.]